MYGKLLVSSASSKTIARYFITLHSPALLSLTLVQVLLLFCCVASVGLHWGYLKLNPTYYMVIPKGQKVFKY